MALHLQAEELWYHDVWPMPNDDPELCVALILSLIACVLLERSRFGLV